MRAGLLLAVVLAGTTGAAAGEDAVDLRGARVLASPEAPEALARSLPGGAPAGPIAWPLPEGPLLLLGLPGQDPAVRALGEAWGILPAEADLAGGYVAAAWHDGRRALGLVLAADGVALRAAWEDLGPDLALPAGIRRVRPRYGVRALDPRGPLPRAIETAVAARANRLWLDVDARSAAATRDAIRRLRRHAVVPVLAATVGTDEDPVRLARRFAPWQREAGVVHFALRFEEVGRPGAWRASLPRAPREEDFVRDLVERLGEAGGCEEVTVLPRARREATTGRGPLPPDLRGVPGAVLAWSGPGTHSSNVPYDLARELAREAGVPVVLLETWAEPWSRSAAPPRIPTSPRGRDPRLGEVLDGIVAVGGPGTGAILSDAWRERPPGPEAWEAALLPHLPRRASSPRAFLRESARVLRRVAARGPADAGWALPLAGHLEERAEALPPEVLGVPRVPAPVTLDGRVDEPPWTYAARLALDEEGAHLLALADGRRLALAVRIPGGGAPVDLRLRDPLGGLSRVGLDPARPDAAGATQHVALALRVDADGSLVAEVAFDAFALGGDAYPTRVLDVEVRRGPQAAGSAFRGALVLLP